MTLHHRSSKVTEAKAYTVTVRKQHPAWDERDGFTVQVVAKSKSEAIKRARRQMEDAGHVGAGCGRATFTAREVTK